MGKLNFFKLLPLVAFMVLGYVSLEASTYYVKTNGTGNGSTWANALSETAFRSTLSTANSGDIFYIAAGTYKPGTTRESTFLIKPGVKIYGGFAGTETGTHASMLAARNLTNNVTILSGDINNDDVVSGAGSTLTITNNGENVYHVVTCDVGATTTNTELNGFVIKGGNANGATAALKSSGGMYNYNSSPAIKNCTFTENSGYYGAGMYSNNSNPEITNCTFIKNSAYYGAGIYNNNTSSPLTVNCTFTDNLAYYGAGIYNKSGSIPNVMNCTFTGNSAYYHFGGGIYNDYSSPTVTNCTFYMNSAYAGGGMYNYASNPEITNCTFYTNSAHTGPGGGISNYASYPTVTNCIFWGNQSVSADPQLTNSGIITYCIIENGASTTFLGLGNKFTDPVLDILKNNGGPTQTIAIKAGSSAIGTGTASYIHNSITKTAPSHDQRGIERHAVNPSIGAYEYNIVTTVDDFVYGDTTENDITVSSPDNANLTITNISTTNTDFAVRVDNGVAKIKMKNTIDVNSYNVPLNITYTFNGIMIVTKNLNVTVVKRPTTLTWGTSTTFTYDATPKTITATINNIVNHDDVIINLSGNTATNAGNYTATADSLTGTKAGNYTLIGGTNISQNWTIAKAPLTVKANNHSIVYGDIPANSGVIYTGFKGSDNVANSLTGTLVYTYNYVQYDNIGTYAITPAGLSGANYEITYQTGDLTVTVRPITLVWSTPTTFIYDATAKSVTAIVSNKVNNDDVTASYQNSGTNVNTATNAGNYNAKVTSLTGTKAGNYTLVGCVNTTQNWIINKAPLTIKANNNSIVYGDAPANAGVTYNGFKGSDDATNSLTGTLVYTYSYTKYDDVGTYTITPAGLSGINYEITYQTGNLTVTSRIITLTWSTPTTFIYDATAKSVTATITNKVNNDNVAVNYQSSGNNVNTATNAGNYTAKVMNLTGPKAGNYTLLGCTNTTQSWNITKAPLTVKANNNSIVYGDAPANTGVTYTGFKGTDNATNSLTGTIIYIYSYAQYGDIGTYTITPAGLNSANYEITYQTGALTVTARPITLTWSAPTTFIYDATVKSVTATISNKVNNDDVTLNYQSSGNNVNTATDAGSYIAKVTNLAGTKAGNYTLVGCVNTTQNWIINKAPLTVKANNNSIVYGDAPANTGVTYTGFKGTDNATNSLTGTLVYTYDYAQYDNVGNYTITPSGLNAINYVITYQSGNLTVTAFPATLTWSTPTTFIYDGTAKSVTATVNNKLNNDNVTLNYQNTGNNVNTAINAGNYTAIVISLAGPKAGNYTLTGCTNTTQSWVIEPPPTPSMTSFFVNRINRTTLGLNWETDSADGLVVIMTTSSTVPTTPTVPMSTTTAPSGSLNTPIKLAGANSLSDVLWTGLTRYTLYYVYAWAYNGNNLSATYERCVVRTSRFKDGLEMSNNETFAVTEVAPMPANVEASFNLFVSEAGNLYVSIYNLSGSKVLDVFNGEPIEAGTEMLIPLNVRDLANGVYTVVVTIGGDRVTRQLVIKK